MGLLLSGRLISADIGALLFLGIWTTEPWEVDIYIFQSFFLNYLGCFWRGGENGVVEGGTASGRWRPLCDFHLPTCSVVIIVQLLSLVWLFATPWTVAYQAPLPMGSPRQEHWRGLPFPSPEKSSRSKDRTYTSCISCTGRWILYHWATWEAPACTVSRASCPQQFGCFPSCCHPWLPGAR